MFYLAVTWQHGAARCCQIQEATDHKNAHHSSLGQFPRSRFGEGMPGMFMHILSTAHSTQLPVAVCRAERARAPARAPLTLGVFDRDTCRCSRSSVHCGSQPGLYVGICSGNSNPHTAMCVKGRFKKRVGKCVKYRRRCGGALQCC